MIISTIIVAFLSCYSGLDYMGPLFAAHNFPYEAFLAVTVIVLYVLMLRKTIPLNFKIEFNKTFFIALPLIVIPFLVMALSMIDMENIDSQAIWMMLGAAISIGIAEELIFRVAGYRVLLASGKSVKRAILLSAAMFSLFHLTNLLSGASALTVLIQLINTFMMGVVLAYVYYQTKSILYPIIIHIVWNFSIFAKNPYGESTLFDAAPLLLTLVYFIWALSHTLKLDHTQQKVATAV